MKLVISLALCLCAQCTSTPPHRHRYVSSAHGDSKHHPRATLVDTVWLDQYRMLEEEYHYWDKADEKIKPEGAKFRVPQAVLDHYKDMQNVDSP